MVLNWLSYLKLILAGVLAALIGYDREKQNKAAGIRTNVIVSVISCLIMILSIEVSKVNLDYGITGDPARLAAQVISGIGFLGAGTIIKQEDKVEGLTTAASLWGVAGLGLAIGYGLFDISIVAALIIFISLRIAPSVKKRL
ncbi:MgtC/SapB family protein [Halanaerobium sp. Z-7514]|uniref:MgtC/SapB family protein n=1 Tax=Halanaerobium polyolivorans TaxID=2886943 RepID=A0AAW4WZ71_9FIRM|nr:MgtC/SapB family protein [Halanaerobium polyolivorans]MCC3144664.1 MgtC/SapB family protein [Halanaerobium polyolivorans]RQD68912.1 MAG: MgtC/SapB family protein [Halanaerobium sp. MSAO_Bac5]